ncbi:MAG: translocation/assembly module TamB domain-containing protein, partial [Marivita lacus]|nr:translocation/assembly module TamB domain-containing protein [Marivita lacus]
VSADVQNPEISAQVTGPLSNLEIDARLANVGLIAPDFQGALVVDGTVGQQADGYAVDVDVQGPGGTTLAVDGRVANGGTANLSIDGAAPLGLANVFIAPRRLNGQAALDLRVSGPLALSSVSGTITPQGAEFSAPTLGIVLSPITGQIQLVNGAAQLGLSAQGNHGGSVDVNGRLGLSTFDAALTATLNRFGVRDPDLYDASVDGTVALNGPIGRDLLVSGDLRLNETEIQVPSTGVTALGTIPPIEHLGATRPVMRTLDRAGIKDPQDTTVEEARGPSSTRLDLTLTAPGQVFVRGRGLDAELAGQLRLTGPTSDIIPQGGFELVRGRLDVLNQRFRLSEGRIRLSGSFTPVLRFVAVTEANGLTVRVILEGPASSPEISFSSSPQLPEDEVLAQLLFGRDLSSLSALQALELASAVAALAGRSGIGLLSNLRDSFGLDDLDVSQTEDGGTAVRAGKYISENVYSDVVVESGGRAEINLNLDVTSDITARGSVDNTGNSSLGIFFERDY